MKSKYEIVNPIKALTCACCGESTRGRQWWNRDTGFGVCAKCVAWQVSRGTDIAEIRDLYGDRGTHWGLESAEIGGILAEALSQSSR